MSERTGLRYGLLGLIVIALLAALAYFVARPPQTPAAAHAAAVEENQLQSLKDVAKQAPVHRKLDIQEWKTAEGAKVLFVEAHELPMFDLRLTFAAGSSQDAGTPGLSMLTNAMLNEGVPGKDTTAIAAGFEDLGASFSNGSYRDMAVAGLRSLSDADKRTQALKLFEQVIGQPTFPEDALARIKNQVLAGFEYQKQNPGKLAGLELFKRLYGEHPYAHSSDGDEKSVPPISREQLQAFHKKAYAAGNVVIALVGDLSRQEAEAIAAEVSKALPQGPALAKTVQPETPKPGLTHIDFPSEQTHLMLAQLGIDRQDPDYAALYLGNQILGGGGFGTRLMDQVREKRGLTYGIYSGFTAMQARGPFMINFQTRAELSEGALKLVQDIVRDYLANGPTQKELDDAKRELAGSFPLSTASNADIVGQLGAIGFYGLPLDYLESFLKQVEGLSVEQVRSAMAKHWTPTPSSSSAPARACRRNPCRHPPPSRPSNPAAFRSIDEQTYCESTRPPRRPGTAADHRWRMAQPAFRLPDGPGLRPTPDRVRETLFNWLAPYVEGARVLDPFAGSGALFLEALSRGAREGLALDTNGEAVAALRNHLDALKCGTAQLVLGDAVRYLGNQAPSAFDLVFLDPPFHQNLLQDACRLLETRGWLNPDAWIYTESESVPSSLGLPGNWRLHREKKAGNVHYALWQRGA